jgi:alkanesulfonate monooxygenase SsuD/methylene tetrahydromethanopterin reductase-like flavin-dependent oxidoreductase (luciferase family)
MFQRDLPPELIAPRAQLLEQLGLDDFWITEDLFFAGGISGAYTALQATERLNVGIGILPALARNAVFTAMEIGILARLFPGRVLAGIGHGMVDWMASVGASVESPVTALQEHLRVVRQLLNGEQVTFRGRYVRVTDAHLEHGPDVPPPVFSGVRGPRSIDATAKVADGIVLAEPTSPSYIRSVRARLDGSGVGWRHQLACYGWLSVDDDADEARERVRPSLASIPGGLAEPSVRPHLEALPFAKEVLALVDSSPDEATLAAGLQPGWIDELAIVGNPEDCARAIMARSEAGADRIVIVPLIDRIEQQLRILGKEVLPLLADS